MDIRSLLPDVIKAADEVSAKVMAIYSSDLKIEFKFDESSIAGADRASAFISKFKPYELVQAGSSFKFCRIAEGHANRYPRLVPTCESDAGAARAVLSASGRC